MKTSLKTIKEYLPYIKNTFENKHTNKQTFKSFCIETIKNSSRKESTKHNLLGTVRIISEFCPSNVWEDLNYIFLKEFEHWMKQKNYAINTIAKHAITIPVMIIFFKCFFIFLVCFQ